MRIKMAGRGLRAALSFAFLAWLLVLPAGVAAHSELEKASPADSASVAGTPSEIVLTFSETLNPDKSSVTLHDATGTQIGSKGAVDPADATVMRLVPPPLEPATYEIRWTSAALDGDILRGTLHFTVAAPTPSPTSPPTASPTTAPSATASASPSLSASPSPSPSPSAAPGPASASGGDVVVPIVAAVVIVGILGAMLLRGRSRGGGGGPA